MEKRCAAVVGLHDIGRSTTPLQGGPCFQAMPSILNRNGVRFATVDFYSSLLGVERVQQVELTPDGPTDAIIKYAHDPDDLSYEYDVRWRQFGGARKESERITASDATIVADELGM